MKITKSQLKQIIKEEMEKVLNEAVGDFERIQADPSLRGGGEQEAERGGGGQEAGPPRSGGGDTDSAPPRERGHRRL